VKEKKNIDRLFQENLKDFEVSPPKRSWDSIENRLTDTSYKSHVPMWAKVSSIAAILVLLFSVVTVYFIPSSNFSKNIFSKKVETKDSIEDKDPIISNPTLTSRPNITDSNTSDLNENLNKVENDLNNIASQTEGKVEILDIDTTQKVDNSENYYLTDAINLPLEKNTSKKINPRKVNLDKFTVATIFAPIYINSFGDGSGVDEKFKGNSTSGNSSYSYGVKVAYKLNNKFSVQSGINLINLGFTTSDIYVAPGVAVVGISNLSTDPFEQSKVASINNNSENLKNITTPDNNNSGSLNQVFGYVEIPVEIKYNVVRGKFDLNLVGGFSTLLLNKDEVFVETNNFTQSLGSSENLRSVNFSGNIGLDVDYSIRKNLFINVSPMFKVQTNTFSKNSGSIQPYYLGVYTGLNYKF